MGDVGKFAATQATKATDMTARVVALYSSKRDGTSKEIDVDIKQETLRAEFKSDFENISFKHIDVENAAAAQTELENTLEGVTAVVACVGSRQPGVARWCATGTSIVTEAMKSKDVSRLVHLSSFGMGDDYIPFRGVRVFWAFLLNVFRNVKNDLIRMEDIVEKSGLDYLLVRPVGLTPEEPPRGSWKLLMSREDGALSFNIAKADVASYMLQEAVTPTLRKRAVTIGQPDR